MKKVVALPAPKPRSVIARNTAWVYAGVLTVMAVGQLFAFEKFIPFMTDADAIGFQVTTPIVLFVLVIAEVFALPFLLRMNLSPLMRWCSLVCSLFVPVVWFVISARIFVTFMFSPAQGWIFGTAVPIPIAYQTVFALVLLCVAIYVTYGLWPGKKK